MTDAFVGEIRLFPLDWAPNGWLLCDGRSLPTSQYAALYALIGNYYGGTGTSTFNLPDMRGRAPLCFTPPNAQNLPSYPLGSAGGEEAHPLLPAEIPPHAHSAYGSAQTAPSANIDPTGNVWSAGQKAYAIPPTPPQPSALKAMSSGAVGTAGGSAPRPNLQPYTVVGFYICNLGIFPSRP